MAKREVTIEAGNLNEAVNRLLMHACGHTAHMKLTVDALARKLAKIELGVKPKKDEVDKLTTRIVNEVYGEVMKRYSHDEIKALAVREYEQLVICIASGGHEP